MASKFAGYGDAHGESADIMECRPIQEFVAILRREIVRQYTATSYHDNAALRAFAYIATVEVRISSQASRVLESIDSEGRQLLNLSTPCMQPEGNSCAPRRAKMRGAAHVLVVLRLTLTMRLVAYDITGVFHQC